jgi:chromosome segregation ATPase
LQVTGIQKFDSFVGILSDAVTSFKTVATERDDFAKDVSGLEKRVRELSANKIVVETKLFESEEREKRSSIRLSQLEEQIADLTEKLREAEICSNERSSVIDRLRSLIEPLRRAVTDMGL